MGLTNLVNKSQTVPSPCHLLYFVHAERGWLEVKETGYDGFFCVCFVLLWYSFLLYLEKDAGWKFLLLWIDFGLFFPFKQKENEMKWKLSLEERRTVEGKYLIKVEEFGVSLALRDSGVHSDFQV